MLKRTGFGVLALAGAALLSSTAMAVDFVALTDRGELVYFSDSAPGRAVRTGIQGAGNPLVGIDVRPADGMLYGVTSEGAVLAIDARTGQAVFRSMLAVPLVRAPGYLVDFNPVADRLRVEAAGGQNLRVHVETGATAVDGPVRFADGSPATVMAGAYTNSVRGTTVTQLFVIDAPSGTYALQDPPNDGILRPIGPTGIIVADGMDILSDGARNLGYAVAGNVLHVFEPATGATWAIGMIGAGVVGRVIDIAVLSPGT